MKKLILGLFFLTSLAYAGNIIVQSGAGTITGVTAGTGISGGGTSGAVTVTNTGVLSVSSTSTGGTPITGAVQLLQGSNITLTQSGQGITIAGSAGGSGTTVYPASATASFPFGISASTITISSNTIIAGATYFANGMIVGQNNVFSIGGPRNTNISDTPFELQGTFQTLALGPFNLGFKSAGGLFDGDIGVTNAGSAGLLYNGQGGGHVFSGGNLQVTGHIVSSGTVPTVGTCGTTPSMNVKSTDNVGAVTWSGGATSCAFTFAGVFVSPPFCLAEAGTAAVTPLGVTTSSATFSFSASQSASTMTYHCFGGSGL